MPWHVEENGGDCSGEEPWAVIADDSGESVSCHATEGEAEDAMAALYANEPDADGAADRSFQLVLCVEGVPFHNDGSWSRVLTVGGGTWRNVPLTLYVQTELPEFGGHAGAVAVGHIDSIERDERTVFGHGVLDSGDLGENAERLIRERTLRFVSIDIGDADVETEVTQVADDGWPMGGVDHFDSYEIISACALGQPALPQAVIWMADMEPPDEKDAPLPEPVARGDGTPEVVESPDMVLLAGGQRAHVPQGAFDHTDAAVADRLAAIVAGGVPFIQLDDDRVFGMLAPFGACHIGYPQGPETCVTAPRSLSAYDHFHTTPLTVVCDDGCEELMMVGVITVGTEHADLNLSAKQTAFHYENTGAVGAYVRAYETDDAIVLSGFVRPGLSDTQRQQLAGPVSGDWRYLGTGLDLVAALRCNTPGFQRSRVHVAAGGTQTALVAAAHRVNNGHGNGHVSGVSPRDLATVDGRYRQLDARLRQVEQLTQPQRDEAVRELAAKLGR